jgi:dTDP-4-dehydrorhamnose reductase
MLHVSTDYVFGGDADSPYEPDDATGPRTVYGRSKLAGELAVQAALPERSWIVRSAWVYGGPGPNFVATMLRLESQQETIAVVDDQVGSPTWVSDLADGLIELGRSQAHPGVLHLANAGQVSWCGLARAVFRGIGADPERIRAVSTAAVPRPAPRPPWSVLSNDSWVSQGLTDPRPWTEALAAALDEMRPTRPH